MKKMVVALRSIVGPEEGCCHARKQGYGKFAEKVDSFFHRFIITVLQSLIYIDVSYIITDALENENARRF